MNFFTKFYRKILFNIKYYKSIRDLKNEIEEYKKYNNKFIQNPTVIENTISENHKDCLEEFYIWKPHPVYKNYEVCDHGEIRHIKNKKIRKKFIKNDYYFIQIQHKGKKKNIYNHVECCTVFKERPRPYTRHNIVLHGDNNKLNCHIDNLKWGTQAKNIQDYYLTK